MSKHGVFVYEQSTGVKSPAVARSGIPFVIGASPIQSADNAATVGVPILCASWGEAVEKLGYSDDWENYNLCEFMYSHFKLYGCQPVIFCNMLDATSMKSSVAAADIDVSNHQVKLSICELCYRGVCNAIY